MIVTSRKYLHPHQEVEFTPFTTVCEIIFQINQNVGMPDISSTGFALMSDWPGVEDPTCYHLFPKMKLCDVISMWSESMDTLNQMRVKQHRSVMLTYWNRSVLVHVCIFAQSDPSLPYYNTFISQSNIFVNRWFGHFSN